MVKIYKNIRFLDYLLNYICKFDLNKIYIIAGYKGNEIYKKYNNTNINLIPIECTIEKKPLGTGGALSLIKNKISQKFLVFNGDSIFNLDLNKIINHNLNKKKSFLAITNNKNYKSNRTLFGLKIKKQIIFKSKKSNLINGGVYFLNKSLIKKLPERYLSLENDIIEKEIKKKKVIGKYFNNFFLDIGTPSNLKLAKKIIPAIFRKPAVFLDRDGTINYDNGYTYKINDFKIIPGTIKKLKELSKKEYYIFIVTNQAGIAKGHFETRDFIKLHKYIKKIMIKKKIYINDVKFCPMHHQAKIKKYRKKTKFRKPGNLMIKEILKRWDINLKSSVMVGDKISDYKCAKKSKIKFYYLKNNLNNTLSN